MGIGLLWATSCTPNYYSPSTTHQPLLKKAGDLQATAALGELSKEGNAAYGITDHLGALASFAYFKRAPSDDPARGFGDGRIIELGAGYYCPLKPVWQFEVYGTYGFGRMSNVFLRATDYTDTEGFLSANFNKWSIQPTFAVTSRIADAMFATKMTYLTYHNIQGTLVHSGQLQTEYLTTRRSSWLWEPTVTVRFGYNPIKVQAQFGVSHNLSHPDFYQTRFITSLGLSTSFSTLFND
jgi:hypothetical protein